MSRRQCGCEPVEADNHLDNHWVSSNDVCHRTCHTAALDNTAQTQSLIHNTTMSLRTVQICVLSPPGLGDMDSPWQRIKGPTKTVSKPDQQFSRCKQFCYLNNTEIVAKAKVQDHMPLITARVRYNIYTYQVCIIVTGISLVDYRHYYNIADNIRCWQWRNGLHKSHFCMFCARLTWLAKASALVSWKEFGHWIKNAGAGRCC